MFANLLRSSVMSSDGVWVCADGDKDVLEHSGERHCIYSYPE